MTPTPRLTWYAHRVRCMSPAEIGWRARDRVVQRVWQSRQVVPGERQRPARVLDDRHFTASLPPDAVTAIPEPAREALVREADRILAGRAEILGVERDDLIAPDWFLCPITGRRAPQATYAFRIDHRSEATTGNVKQLWELSRLHHLTVLAAAWRLTRREPYAARVAAHLRSWWEENPFLSGVHWTNGIEVGIRLISWVWVRRLLDGWSGAAGLFEDDEIALAQIRGHQEHLATFRSRGSSANNHVVAEAAGQLVAACAFPWFPESERWRVTAAALLEDELARNTFPSGVDRELAFDYHGLVAELGLVAAIESAAAGHPLSDATWQRLARMIDVVAACVDETLQPPRQNDSDDGRALVLDAPTQNRWSSLLALGGRLFEPKVWWPVVEHDVWSCLVGALVTQCAPTAGHLDRRPSQFADAGLTLLRTDPADGPEIWCRCDGGPHGFLSIAAHAHADALAVEVRHGGVDVLADPGTYCYHGERAWRDYFRSTVAHNSVEVSGRDQSVPGGPFLWLRHAESHVVGIEEDDAGVRSWSAEHDGYRRLVGVRHRRTVVLDRAARRLEITDVLWGGGDGESFRMAWHLGPAVRARLSPAGADLEWDDDRADEVARASLGLSADLDWTVHRGETDPILGWYSPGFGRKVPTTTLLGAGTLRRTTTLRTTLTFAPIRPARSGAVESHETVRA